MRKKRKEKENKTKQNKTKQNKTKQNKRKGKKTKQNKRKEKKRKEKKRKEKKRKEKKREPCLIKWPCSFRIRKKAAMVGSLGNILIYLLPFCFPFTHKPCQKSSFDALHGACCFSTESEKQKEFFFSSPTFLTGNYFGGSNKIVSGGDLVAHPSSRRQHCGCVLKEAHFVFLVTGFIHKNQQINAPGESQGTYKYKYIFYQYKKYTTYKKLKKTFGNRRGRTLKPRGEGVGQGAVLGFPKRESLV